MRVLAADLRYIEKRAPPLNRARIAVVGAQGFIGFELMAYFEYAGISARGFDRGATADLGDPTHIMFLAGIADPAQYQLYPKDTLEATRLLWDVLDRYPKTRILYFSSSEVYGDAQVPMHESRLGASQLAGARAVYAEGKRFGEMLVQQHENASIVRPFNNYGPGLKRSDSRAPARFAYAAHDGKPLEVHAGSGTRTYCYVADAIVGYLMALVGPSGTYNIGAELPELTAIELALHFSQDFRLIPAPSWTREFRRIPDLTRARTLGYEPGISIEEGIRRFMEFLDSPT